MWAIANKTLVADRGKLLTALVGVIFSIVLVNIQGGLFIGLIRKAGLLVDHGQADIWVGHKLMHNVDFPLQIPMRWIDRVRAIPGVELVEPYVVGWSTMTLPSGGFESVVVIGSDRGSLLGHAWNLRQGRRDSVLETDGIVVDECELEKLEHPKLREIREIGGRRARIVGFSSGITGFLIAPYVFTTLDRASAYIRSPGGTCSYFLVRLQKSADTAAVCQQIKQRVPELDAFPRDAYSRMSVDFWMRRTGLGISFGAATMLGLVVGLVMVAQTLYASVLDRITEFATLKALGASERQVYRILFVQSITMATVGSLVGLMLVAGIQELFSTPFAPIRVSWWLALGSFALVLAICLLSSIVPYARIRKVDPMLVLQ
jgi:putative ABC transport system permease protein